MPTAPDLLPGLPETGYGVPLVPLPQGAAGTPQGPLAIPPATGLASPFAGVAALPTTGPRGPAWLIQPTATIGELFTDNVLRTATHRIADAATQLIPGVSVLADTPRIQGQLSAGLEYDKYAVVDSQDRILGDLYANGLATIVPDSVYLDVRSALTETSSSGGLGFTNVSQIPQSQLVQVFTTTVSPYYRHSFGDQLDGELRYRFSSTSFSNGSLLSSAPTTNALTTASDAVEHEGTATLATGSRFQRLSSRLTLDAAQVDSTSIAQSTQLNAYDDVQYHITDTISALGRIGYQNIRYSQAPAANVDSPTYLIGGRIDFGPRGYATLQYGRQQGTNGLSGSARYDVTPNTTISASIAQGRSTPQQQITGALATSTLTPIGGLINQSTGLPLSLVNQQFALQNVVFTYRSFNFGVSSTIAGANSVSLLVDYQERTALAGGSGSSNSTSVILSWARTITPDLTGSASLGYTSVENATFGNFTGVGNSGEFYTANFGVSYLIGYNLTGSVLYSFSYDTNPAPAIAVTGGQGGDVLVNLLQLRLSKAF